MKYILGYKRDKNGNMIWDDSCRLNIKEIFEFARDKANSYADVRREFGVYYHKGNVKNIESVNKDILNNSNHFNFINEKYGISKKDFDYINKHNGKQPPFSLNTITDVRKILMNEKYCGDEILPSIISNDLFKAVQEKISTFTKRNSSPFLLTGLICCGECGLALRYIRWRTKNDKDIKSHSTYRLVCSQNNVKQRGDRPDKKPRSCIFTDDIKNAIDAFELERKIINDVLGSQNISEEEKNKLEEYYKKSFEKYFYDTITKENLNLSKECRNILMIYVRKIMVKDLNKIQMKYNDEISEKVKSNVRISTPMSSNNSLDNQKFA